MDRTFSRPNRTCGLGGEGVLMWGLLSSLFHMKSRSPGTRVDPLLAPFALKMIQGVSFPVKISIHAPYIIYLRKYKHFHDIHHYSARSLA